MTVKCLTDTEKQFIAEQYTTRKMLQVELAEFLFVSERTINRVLIEKGLATPVERIKGEAYQVMQLLKEHGLDLPSLRQVIKEHRIMKLAGTVA